jgi:cyclophilin family peptidyl-prolyl cis-trans isomerase
MKLSKKTVITALIVVLFLGSTLISLASMFSKDDGEMKEIVVFETTMGAIELELNREKAPVTVANFVKYVEEGFFNGTVFHRVIPEFMIQGGGFLPNMTQKATEDPIELESDNGLKNDRGTVAMARTSDPDSATSQFFINLIDNDFLNRRSGVDGYAVFGEVVTGMDVVDKIGAVRTGSKGPFQDWPVRDVVIEGAYVKDGADS